MAKSKKKVTKPNYKYNTKVGGTDYDIPVFGYKSAFIILFGTFIPLLIIPSICNYFNFDYRIPTILLVGFCSGFSVAYTQFFVEKNIGFNKNFWILTVLASLVAAGLIFLLVYAGVLL